MTLAIVVEGLAWCHARRGRAEQAARLMGCANAAWEQLHMRFIGLEAQVNAHVELELREALGDVRLGELRAEGRGVSPRDAIDDALGQDPTRELLGDL